jgi:hypothetical protein
MKPIPLLVMSLSLLIFIPAAVPAKDVVPVFYLQLPNEERYIYPSDLERLNWREIRKQRQLNRTANQEPKCFEIRVLDSQKDKPASSPPNGGLPATAISLMRDPNGIISKLSAPSEGKQNLKIPHDDHLVGRYLLGSHILYGDRDVDGDGHAESVHLCPKHLVAHYKNGGERGSASVVFFDDGQLMPLEIGPVINTAKSIYGGGTQRPHRNYEMMVKYLGQPLPGAEVTVIALDSQWQKSVVTDQNGKFSIMPTDDRCTTRQWQKYLYLATYHDRPKKSYYMATLPIVVRKNTPEWRSKAMGFTYWAVVGSAGGLLIVWGFVRRKIRRHEQALTIFRDHRIEKELS